jgi:hypothetical protein
MHDCSTSGPDTTGADDAPGTNHGIRVSRLDSHGRAERSDGDRGENKQAHDCFLSLWFCNTSQVRFRAGNIAALMGYIRLRSG